MAYANEKKITLVKASKNKINKFSILYCVTIKNISRLYEAYHKGIIMVSFMIVSFIQE